MKLRGFEVQVTSQTGQPFHEVVDNQTGEVYIVAEADKIFEIRYSILSAERANRGKKYAFCTKVDGKSTGRMDICADSNTGWIKTVGFVVERSQKDTKFDLFKFAAASHDHNNIAQSSKFKEGRIKVRVHKAVLEQTNVSPSAYTKKHVPISKVPSLGEGKKFFLAPSLMTSSGGIHVRKGRGSTTKHKRVKKEATFSFRYETPSTLLLRGILRRENPAHAAILDSFPETRQEQSRFQHTSSTVNLVKTERRIKTERNAQGPASSSAFREIINLADSSPAHAPCTLGKDLICDLTGDDDAPPRWQKQQQACG